jgi:hypothetical protein
MQQWRMASHLMPCNVAVNARMCKPTRLFTDERRLMEGWEGLA